mmetsp:Transcript_39037/g.83308  ORF Transcript_39037/g.83308 Transcript_39037/m.83308 type:complete len:207 (+) Transcript_39037:186-806(+)
MVQVNQTLRGKPADPARLRERRRTKRLQLLDLLLAERLEDRVVVHDVGGDAQTLGPSPRLDVLLLPCHVGLVLYRRLDRVVHRGRREVHPCTVDDVGGFPLRGRRFLLRAFLLEHVGHDPLHHFQTDVGHPQHLLGALLVTLPPRPVRRRASHDVVPPPFAPLGHVQLEIAQPVHAVRDHRPPHGQRRQPLGIRHQPVLGAPFREA